ncbi:MAG: LptA/OstA family protein [Pseudomonadota bacterium]
MKLIILSLLGVWLFALPAVAQLSPDGGPIQINADRLDVLERENKATYVGNVDVLQASARLRSDKLTINFKSSGEGRQGGVGGSFGAPDTMVAEGEVFYVTPDLKARGDRGVYTADTDTVLLTGNVILERGEDIAVGECLTLEISAGKSTLGCGADGDRVITQITPTNPGDSE